MSNDNVSFLENSDVISNIIIKQLQNEEISAYENSILEKWVSSSLENKRLYNRAISGGLFDEDDLRIIKRAEEEKKAVTKKIAQTLFPMVIVGNVSNAGRVWKKVMFAAAVVLPVVVGTYLLLNIDNSNKDTAGSTQQHNAQDKLPGKEGAILRLSDGREIILDNAKDGKLAAEGNAEIVKRGGELYYNSNSHASKVLYNTLITPLGRQFQLRLPDNSRIWLNAGSTVTYPTVFGPEDRSIIVDGEVYLEVVKDHKRPFLVAVQGSTIKVLGTKFNVAGYSKSQSVKTTLVEGKVSVTTGTTSTTLMPRQQAVIKSKALSVINDVDTETATAWKDGFILFTGFDIHEILDQISRWYQVEIQYVGEVNAPDIKGRAYRNAPLSDVIKVLELSSGLKFRLDGNTLKVEMP